MLLSLFEYYTWQKTASSDFGATITISRLMRSFQFNRIRERAKPGDLVQTGGGGRSAIAEKCVS